VIEGAFGFVVDAPVPTTTPATTVVPTSAAPTTVGPTTGPPVSSPPTSVSGEQLDDFLAGGGPTQDGARRVGDIGRGVGFVGVVLAVGAIAFAFFVTRQRPLDRGVATAAGIAGGVLAAVGALVEGLCHAGAVSGVTACPSLATRQRRSMR